MNYESVLLAATQRAEARRAIRQARGGALVGLLSGQSVSPSAIDSSSRQAERARLLNRSDLASDVSQDPAAGGKVLEAVIGDDDMIPSRFLTLGALAARAVGRIVVRNSNGSGLYGTGSLLSSGLLLTNNHVLESKAAAANAVIELGYIQTAPNAPPNNFQSFQLQPDDFFYTNEELDFTIVSVATTNGSASTSDYGSLALIAGSGKALVGEKINIIQHAGGQPQEISIRANTLVDIFDQYLHYTTDTAPGSSGSPVFNDEWQVVGLHHAAVPDSSSGSSGSIINEGIRISSIVQQLTAAFGQGTAASG